MCWTKDTSKRQELEIKKCKKYILKLLRESKANHFNFFFHEKKK